MLLNYDIVGIEKLDEICSPTFVVNEFSGFFLHPSIFSTKRQSFLINDKWCFIRFLVLIKF